MKNYALITGASKGIGLELAKLFAKDGYSLVMVARSNDLLEKLKGCKVQGTYVGRITDIHKGVCYVRLGIKVNGIAHTNKANRPLGKGDMVNFTVTHLDEKKVVAHGLITRIIQQNIRG